MVCFLGFGTLVLLPVLGCFASRFSFLWVDIIYILGGFVCFLTLGGFGFGVVVRVCDLVLAVWLCLLRACFSGAGLICRFAVL